VNCPEHFETLHHTVSNCNTVSNPLRIALFVKPSIKQAP